MTRTPDVWERLDRRLGTTPLLSGIFGDGPRTMRSVEVVLLVLRHAAYRHAVAASWVLAEVSARPVLCLARFRPSPAEAFHRFEDLVWFRPSSKFRTHLFRIAHGHWLGPAGRAVFEMYDDERVDPWILILMAPGEHTGDIVFVSGHDWISHGIGRPAPPRSRRLSDAVDDLNRHLFGE